jgi:autophagy-related protein 5
MTASFLAARPLGRAIVHGIAIPLDAEVGWLGATMCGADGWVSVVVAPEAR